jgi:hypothetical protein
MRRYSIYFPPHSSGMVLHSFGADAMAGGVLSADNEAQAAGVTDGDGR